MPKESVKMRNLTAVPDLPETAEEEVCRICFGSGMEIIPGKGARVCECRRQESHSNYLQKAKLPARYANCHFHNYKPRNASQQTAFRFASTLTMEYPAVDRGILLTGSVGVGK